MKKILFLGDVVGRAGRNFIYDRMTAVREETQADFVIVNGENSAGGSGINADIARAFLSHGVDAVTLGDHVWDQRGFDSTVAKLSGICRPANVPVGNPGAEYVILTDASGFRLLVFTVLGQTFMRAKSSCPFRCASALLKRLAGTFDTAFVEIHAEATSEKIALGRYLDGRVAAVVGTHTHVATADECILPAGTAYQTDAGMCGGHDGVIGRNADSVIRCYLDGRPRHLEVCMTGVRLNGCLISYDEEQKKSVEISRFRLDRTERQERQARQDRQD